MTIAVFLLLALAARSVGWLGAGVTLAVGAAGIAMPMPRETSRRSVWLFVVAIGSCAFLLARWRIAVPSPRIGPIGLLVTVAAAIAEEALFRRYLYGLLARWGDAAAIVGAAAAFALIHLPNYGLSSAPLNLAAGLLFGWQRWVSRSWTAPAATHAVANLLQAL